MADFATIQRYSDDELFAQLKARGVTTPVNSSTRKVLEKKLAKLLGISLEDSLQSARNVEEFYDDADVTLDDSMLGGRGYDNADVVHRFGRQGHDTFGNSFYVEEVDSRPSDQLRARRASELAHLSEELDTQKQINKGCGPAAGQGSRKALVVLAILVLIGAFLIFSYFTEGDSVEETTRIPTVKVVPGSSSIPAKDL